MLSLLIYRNEILNRPLPYWVDINRIITQSPIIIRASQDFLI